MTLPTMLDLDAELSQPRDLETYCGAKRPTFISMRGSSELPSIRTWHWYHYDLVSARGSVS